MVKKEKLENQRKAEEPGRKVYQSQECLGTSVRAGRII